ncbi:MAG: UbiA family prenyltransferase, partial [Planctomycetota bacterium]
MRRLPRPSALGRLLRLSLLPSPLADAAAGIVFAAGAWPAGAGPWLLLAGAAASYHGGMALNDWVDRGRDSSSAPRRPLPAGEVDPRLALGLALALLAAGPLLASAAHPVAGAIAALVAGAALAYDLAGRGAWRGPGLLAACRAGNLGTGLALGAIHAVGGAPAPRALLVLFPPALLYSLYVFLVARLGRLEDAEDPRPLGR